MVDRDRVLAEARGLFDSDFNPDSPSDVSGVDGEYLRAVIELASRILGYTSDEYDVVAKMLWPSPPHWHDGDVVQTQIPYDDFPITLVRIDGRWRAVVPDPNKADVPPSEYRFDAEIDQWVEQEIAVVKVRQSHQFNWTRDPAKPYGPCHFCGVEATGEEVDD